MKNAKWYVRNEAREAEVWLYDEIGEDWFGEGISAKAFIEDLNGLPAGVEKVIVRINSPGGDVFAGFAMYQALLRHKAEIVVAIDSLAASAASVVAMAGDTVNAAETSMVMVHDPWAMGIGNAADFRQLANTLDKVSGQIVTAYARRDRVNPIMIAEAMAAETWYTAAEAKAVGLVDAVTETTVGIAAKVPPGRYARTPARLIGATPVPNNPEVIRKRLAAAQRMLELVGP